MPSHITAQVRRYRCRITPSTGPSASACRRARRCLPWVPANAWISNSRWAFSWDEECHRFGDSDRHGGVARLRDLSAQRLVGAGYPGLGISTPRTIPGKKFCDDDFTLGRDHGGAGAVSAAVLASRDGPAATALPRRCRRSRAGADRHGTRGVAADGADAGTGSAGGTPGALEFSPWLLDDRSDDRAPYGEWLQSPGRRPARQRHDVRRIGERSRFAAGIDRGRSTTLDASERRKPHLFGGWRQRRAARLVRAPWSCAHRLRFGPATVSAARIA